MKSNDLSIYVLMLFNVSPCFSMFFHVRPARRSLAPDVCDVQAGSTKIEQCIKAQNMATVPKTLYVFASIFWKIVTFLKVLNEF